MPRIEMLYQVKSDGRTSDITKTNLVELSELLVRYCIRHLSVNELVLTPKDFDVVMTPIAYPGQLAHQFSVYVTLHHFPRRVEEAQARADFLIRDISEYLNTERNQEIYGFRTAAVTFVLAELAWSEARVL